MPDWKRILVGEDSKLPSPDLNYYRDLLLVSPFFLFTLGGLAHILGAQNERMLAFKFLALAAVSIALASERLILFIAAIGVCSLRLMFAFVIYHDVPTLLTLLASIIPILLALRFIRNYKPSYALPAAVDVVTFVIVASSFLISLKALILLDSSPL
jgi:nicotinamide riboside transporter PnuC